MRFSPSGWFLDNSRMRVPNAGQYTFWKRTKWPAHCQLPVGFHHNTDIWMVRKKKPKLCTKSKTRKMLQLTSVTSGTPSALRPEHESQFVCHQPSRRKTLRKIPNCRWPTRIYAPVSFGHALRERCCRQRRT